MTHGARLPFARLDTELIVLAPTGRQKVLREPNVSGGRGSGRDHRHELPRRLNSSAGLTRN